MVKSLYAFALLFYLKQSVVAIYKREKFTTYFLYFNMSRCMLKFTKGITINLGPK